VVGEKRMTDPLKPDAGLLCKLGSILIHVEEHGGETGVEIDMDTVRLLLNDEQVQVWLFEMNKLGLLPVKR
jgi:hypothetical protein